MKKIILFGDSIFNGYRDGCDTNLVTNLFKKQLNNYTQVENISKSGATTVEGVDYLVQIPAEKDLTVVEYGNNDAATAWGISPENYEKFKKTAARLNELELYEAYKNSLLLVMELRNLVEKQYQLTVSDDFLGKLFNYMNE